MTFFMQVKKKIEMQGMKNQTFQVFKTWKVF